MISHAAFDIGNPTGIAIDYGDSIRAFSWKPSAKRPPGYGPQEIIVDHEARIREEFRREIWSLLVQEGIDIVAYEEPRKRDFGVTKPVVQTTQEFGKRPFQKQVVRSSSNLALVRGIGLAAELVGVCQTLGIRTVEVKPDDWRKSLMGISRAPKHIQGNGDGRKWWKTEVFEHVRKLGIEVPNSDAADAVGVLLHLRGLINPQKFRRANDLFSLAPTGGI